MTTVAADLPTTSVPEPRRDPDAPWKGQAKYAVDLMRRLWGHDPEVCDELTANLYTLSRTQLNKVTDNLMWTLANQPRLMNRAQLQHIETLWGRKMSKPIDAPARAKFAQMTEEDAQRMVYKLQALPDRPR